MIVGYRFTDVSGQRIGPIVKGQAVHLLPTYTVQLSRRPKTSYTTLRNKGKGKGKVVKVKVKAEFTLE